LGESVAAGVDIVCASGDKLLGGPQAGILVGRRAAIERCRRHPLARAVRADKTCLAGLEATLRHYLAGEAVSTVPVWRMIALSDAEIAARAHAWAAALTALGLTGATGQPDRSAVGGVRCPARRCRRPCWPYRWLACPVAEAALRRLRTGQTLIAAPSRPPPARPTHRLPRGRPTGAGPPGRCAHRSRLTTDW
jgi:L-seryl-tRNA(Ser) seleniumtransferase